MIKIISTPKSYTSILKNHNFNKLIFITSQRYFTRSSILLKENENILSKNDMKINPVNVQLLSPNLHQQLFTSYSQQEKQNKNSIDMPTREALSKEHLKLQDIWGKKSDKMTPIDIQLPAMYGNNIEEHFMRIGLEQASSLIDQCKQFAELDTLPPLPTETINEFQWKKTAGWTRYEGSDIKSVKTPLEDSLVFDVEVLVKEGHYPIMAIAASSKAWYSWTSPYLITGKEKDKTVLIPINKSIKKTNNNSNNNNNNKKKKERIVIGHNVGYDRARIADEYSRIPSGIRYIDTMSLHIAVAGLCSQQRSAWNAILKNRQDNITSDHHHHQLDINEPNSFMDVSSLNSLKDVAKFHCNIDMDKTQRSYFENGSLQDIQENFNDLMTYCAQDVLTTYHVYKTLLPKFLNNCPHPVSFAGMVEMGNSFLTVTERWEKYLENAVSKHKELDDMLDAKLQALANQARELVSQPEKWENDPWLSQLDWTVNPRQRKLKGAPKWYKDAYETKTGKLKLTTRSRISPLLLRLKWQGYPLHYVTDHGWCFKMKPSQMIDHPSPSSLKMVYNDQLYCYFKVPHKDGEDANCGNPLAKNYLGAYEDQVLSSEYDAAKEALELNATSAYWISSRERILGQFVVWDDNTSVDLNLSKQDKEEEEEEKDDNHKYGMILPQMVTMGTVTRRAVEKTWLTASNAKKNRIGSELKSMVQAPKGYKIVGADVDSEELWISSVIGDAQFGFHGATALGWMTLQGSKSEGTDLHSKTANILGISRDKAKIFNYARIYGAGVKYATGLLIQYNQGMSVEMAKSKATELYSSTKGEKERGKRNPFKRHFWHGGSESFMFNALEDIALSNDPRTPVLGCAVTDALKPKYTKDQFLTSRINWVVQSSGVDYLHMLLVSMQHLIDRYQIDARFMLSVHDEVRYLSSEKDQHRTAFALQVANLWTRALFSYKLGIYNLPQSIGFFSAVDIDHVLRKEPTMTCTTPSNDEAIDIGISCTIQETIKELEKEYNLNGEVDCLLGHAMDTKGKKLSESIITEALMSMNFICGQREKYDTSFLKAQLYKNYLDKLDPSIQGGKQTEEKISKANTSTKTGIKKKIAMC
ncbi:unnamed protein product [Cunninghamella echinulata]